MGNADELGYERRTIAVEPTFIEIFYWSILPALGQALAIFLGIFFGILVVSKRISSSLRNNSADDTKSALEMVRERYAKGEISRREYEQMREDLESESTDLSQTTSGPN